MKRKLAMVILGAVLATTGIGLATSAAASGPGGACRVKSVAEMVSDWRSTGKLSPIECYY